MVWKFILVGAICFIVGVFVSAIYYAKHYNEFGNELFYSFRDAYDEREKLMDLQINLLDKSDPNYYQACYAYFNRFEKDVFSMINTMVYSSTIHNTINRVYLDYRAEKNKLASSQLRENIIIEDPEDKKKNKETESEDK